MAGAEPINTKRLDGNSLLVVSLNEIINTSLPPTPKKPNMKLPIVSACVLISSVSLANASTLVIDDFSYDLAFDAVVTNWNSFGAAATAGAGVFHPGEGVDGSNAMRFALD